MAGRVLFIAASLVGLLSGCTYLPSGGPSNPARDALASIFVPDETPSDLSGFALVEVSSGVIKSVPNHGPSRLSSSFGLTKGEPPVTRIVIGDTIVVTIFESAEGGLFLSAGQAGRPGNYIQIPAQTVDSSGSIYVPFAGNIKVIDRTLSQISGEIERKLQDRAIEPKVVVSIQARENNRVSVLGEVGSPGEIPININGDRILDVIAKSGGIKHPGYESYVKLSRKNYSQSVNFTSVVENAKENIFVQPGDTVYVYREPQSFVAMGAFGSENQVTSKRVPFTSQTISLIEAVGEVGGLNDNKADPREVFVYRLEDRQTLMKMGVDLASMPPSLQEIPTVYRLNLRDTAGLFNAQLFKMRDKDVLYAANAGSVELSKFMSLIRNIGETTIITDRATDIIGN